MSHELEGETCLVTGAAGMLGIQLCRQLYDVEGAYVVAADMAKDKPKDLVAIAYRRLDLNDEALVAELIASTKPAYLFHLAGAKGGAGIGRRNGLDFLLANVTCTIGIVRQALDKVKRMLFTSSVGAYPGNKSLFKETDAWSGEPHQSDYWGGWAKRYGELMCKAAAEQYGLDYVVVRPTNCFGPLDRFDKDTGMVIPALIARLEAGENPLVLKCNQNAMRDFLYAPECARGMIAAMKNGRSGEIYNLGVGSPVYIARIAEMLCGIYGVRLEVNHCDDSAPNIRCMDMTKSKKELGFTPVPNGMIANQLRETVEWYKENKGLVTFDPFKTST